MWPGFVNAQNAAPNSSTDVDADSDTAPPCDGAQETQAAQETQDRASADSDQQAPAKTPAPACPQKPGEDSQGDQTKRILGVMPNYRAVGADLLLPPLSPRGKFVLATHDSLDYTSALFAGALAAYKFGTAAYPEFHSGYAGYGRYLWRAFVDQAVGNYFTEAIVPTVLHEDPRYYTLGHGGFLKRTYYAITRLVVTKTDAGGMRFNFSEIVGNGLGAGVANFYYPAQERTLGRNMENWGTQVGADGVANVVKEFWPDVRRKLLKRKLGGSAADR